MRSFTHGYDLFTPHRNIVWHEYTREYRTHKHWVDHVDQNKEKLVDGLNWVERNNICHHRNRVLFEMETDPNIVFGKYGVGKERTLREYEEYAGIDFKSRTELLPDNKAKYEYQLTWQWDQFHQADDLDFVVLAIHNDTDTLWREDCTKQSRPNLWNKDYKPKDILRDGPTRIVVKFDAVRNAKPNRLVIWPHSISRGWMNRVDLHMGQIGY
jgi:hypothetical protein